MDLLNSAQIVLRRWWLLILLAVVGAACGYYAGANLPKRYQSTVSLQLNPAAQSSLLPYSQQAQTSSYTDPVAGLAASYGEVLKSRSFGELVVQRLQLNVPPTAVSGAIATKLVPNTNIMRLTVTWDHPEDAQQLAQAVADVFLQENARRQQTAGGDQGRLPQLEESARSMQARLGPLQQQRDALDQGVARGDLSRASELNDLDSRLTAVQTSYANLLVEINRIRSSMDTATVLDQATKASAVGGLSTSQASLLGLVVGLGIAVGVAFLLEHLDDLLRTPEDLVATIGSAPLAAISNAPASSKARKTGGGLRLVVLNAPRSQAAEAFRTLRANLRLASIDKPLGTILVTSAAPQEGKTFVSGNLAITLAQSGKRTLLIDADLRRPSLHKEFGVENTFGLSDAILRNEARLAALGDRAELADPEDTAGALATGTPNLFVLPSGHVPPNPSELLGTEAMRRLLERYRQLFDMIILDTAPVGPVADTLVLAPHVDGLLVVARSDQTRRAALRSVLESLGATGRPVLGVVFNNLRPGPLSRYSQYAYYYYGYYGNSYYGSQARSGGGGGDAAGHPNGHVNGRVPEPVVAMSRSAESPGAPGNA